jgi:indolepyruvate ferredoxin oxidoreductase beta subunit
MKEDKNIIVAGVGGQGILLASEIISLVAMQSGYDVKKSEVHGLSQRGGDVVSHVRIGERVYSPLIEEGTAHILLSFEKAESLRYIHYLIPGESVCIINDLEIIPLRVSLRIDSYPADIIEKLKRVTPKVYLVDAIKYAKEAGDTRSFNIFILGIASHFLPFGERDWKGVLEERIPPPLREVNIRAFDLGREWFKRL